MFNLKNLFFVTAFSILIRETNPYIIRFEGGLKIITGRGYMPVDVIDEQTWFDSTINRIPLVRNGESVRKTYCAFWRKDNSGYYVEEFAALLKAIF